MNMLDSILNPRGNVEDQEDYGFKASFFRISPNVIDEITKNKLLNMQLVSLRSQRDIDNIYK